jgi:hypothetical protein
MSIVVGTTSSTTMAATCHEEQRVSHEEIRPSCSGRGKQVEGQQVMRDRMERAVLGGGCEDGCGASSQSSTNILWGSNEDTPAAAAVYLPQGTDP